MRGCEFEEARAGDRAGEDDAVRVTIEV